MKKILFSFLIVLLLSSPTHANSRVSKIEKENAENYYINHIKQQEFRLKVPVSVITFPNYTWDIYTFYAIKSAKYTKKNDDGSYFIIYNTIFKSNTGKFIVKKIKMYYKNGFILDLNLQQDLANLYINKKFPNEEVKKVKIAFENLMKLDFYINKNADPINSYMPEFKHLEELRYFSNKNIECEYIPYYNTQLNEIFFNSDYTCKIPTIFKNSNKQLELITQISNKNGKFEFAIGRYNNKFLYSKVDFSTMNINPQNYWFKIAQTQSVKIGMPENYLILALGEPLKKHYYNNSHVIKQYVYGDFGPYVYVENGKVTSWQN